MAKMVAQAATAARAVQQEPRCLVVAPAQMVTVVCPVRVVRAVRVGRVIQTNPAKRAGTAERVGMAASRVVHRPHSA